MSFEHGKFDLTFYLKKNKMTTTINLVRVGDYVHDFGVVTKVRHFYKDKANKSKVAPNTNKFVPITSSGQYARIVAVQHDQQYEKVLDSVVISNGVISRSYTVDSEVRIYRMKEAV